MEGLIGKISFCPKCGKKLLKAYGPAGNKVYSLCPDSGCRFGVVGGECVELELYDYSRLRDKVYIEKDDTTTFMLLKTNLNGPLLQKLTNSYDDNDRSMYCIVQAKDREDALRKFKKKFVYTKVTEEMVVPVHIKEKDW